MRNKHIIVVLNQDVFVKHRFGDESWQQSSSLKWRPLTPTVPTEYKFTVMRSLAKLNDSLLGLNFIFRQEGEGFDYETKISAEINNSKEFNVQTMITFELSNK